MFFLMVKKFDHPQPRFFGPHTRSETVRNVPILGTVLPVPTGAFLQKHHAVPPRQFSAIGQMGKIRPENGKKIIEFFPFSKTGKTQIGKKREKLGKVPSIPTSVTHSNIFCVLC